MNIRNQTQLVGNLGKEPEVRTFESGKKLATFPIAVNESFTNNKGDREISVNWFNVSVWGKQAENVEKILKKGSYVAINGKLISRSFEKDGETRYVTEIQMNEFLSLDKQESES